MKKKEETNYYLEKINPLDRIELKQAKKLYNNSQYNEAVEILEKFYLDKSSGISEKHLELLANAYYFDGQFRKSYEVFEEYQVEKTNYIYMKTLLKVGYYAKSAKLLNEKFEQYNLDETNFKEELILLIQSNYYAGNISYVDYTNMWLKEYSSYFLWEDFSARGLWDLSILTLESYIKEISEVPVKLYYSLAKYYVHTFDYTKAKEYLYTCLEVEKKDHFLILLSIVEERLHNSDEAIKLIESIDIENHPNKVNIGYRLGLLYMSKKLYKEAAEIFSKYKFNNTISNSVILADSNFIQAIKYESLDENEKAIDFYVNTLNNYRGHFAPLYSKIGELYYKNGNYEKACTYFKQYNIYDKFYGFDSKTMPEHSRVSYYIEQWQTLPVDPHTALYCAYNGEVFSGNLLAIFRKLQSNKQMKHFIALKNIETAPQELIDQHNVHFVQYESRLHYRLLASSKFIFTNGSYQVEFIRKEEQIALNTWHGTPIKKLGFDVQQSSYQQSRNIIKSYYASTHIIHPNQQTKKSIIDAFGLKNGYKHSVTGYPRQDMTLKISEQRKLEIKKMLGLELFKPVLLYATTLRDGTNKENKKISSMQQKVIKKLKNLKGYNFIYKGHYSEIKNTTIDKMDSNELLAIVDVLITDYSSIAIDYLVTNKPLIFFVPDIKNYEKQRGLNFSPSDLTQNVVYNIKDLILLAKNIINETEDYKRHEAKSKLCEYDDGNATKRVLDELTSEKINSEEKQKLLIFAGNILLVNGITSAFKNILKHIDFNTFEVYVLLTHSSFNRDYDEKILDDLRIMGCSFIFYYGSVSANRVERYAYNKFNENQYFYNDYHKSIYINMMKRTAKRIFGNLSFDKVINFESGYSRDISIILSLLNTKDKLIVLHSDMEKEQKLRFPQLKNTFYFLKEYSHVLSVSKAVSDENYNSIGQYYGVNVNQIDTLPNFMNSRIIEMSNKDSLNSRERKLFNFDKTFISVGRLSVEKNHSLLIDAFAKVIYTKKLNINLIIIGEGPLRSKLIEQIETNKMEKYITIISFRDNPYPLIKKSHCLISSSKQEGQGLVLLEALALKTSILVTNIPASSEIVEKYGGALCREDIDDMTEKIIQIVDQPHQRNNFDLENYNYEVQKKFKNIFYGM